MVDHGNRKILAREIGRPTFAAIGRRLVGDAGVTRTMHHDDRRRADGFRDAVMDIHLVGHDLPSRKARSVTRMTASGDLAADEEIPFVLQFHRPTERCGGRRRDPKRKTGGPNHATRHDRSELSHHVLHVILPGTWTIPALPCAACALQKTEATYVATGVIQRHATLAIGV